MTPQKVYVLMGNYNHTDRDVLGVYASEESACEEWRKKVPGSEEYNTYYVEERELLP